MSLVLTKAALALKNAEDNFKFVKFEAHKPKKKEAREEKDAKLSQREANIKKDLDLKKIRHEVVKFGMSGFDPSKKEEARVALAVSLGAKPPKKEYINYKDLMQKRKQEKQKEADEKQTMRSKSVMQSGGKKKKKAGNDVGHFLDGYGKKKKTSKETGQKSNSYKTVVGLESYDVLDPTYHRVQKKDLKTDNRGKKKRKK